MSGVLIGSLSSNYNCFQNKTAVENQIVSKKKLKKLKAHTIPLKAKEATIYGANLFPKEKSIF
jgi:ABC-type polar amino acid transport system ATPase subunit